LVEHTQKQGLTSGAPSSSSLDEPADSTRFVRRLRVVGLGTIGIIYLLILVGGIVRATGSGMGCPDWPQCFGRWIPPTAESQLPADYQQIYADRGYRDTTFNVRKTWTEYLNRLLGAFTGLAIFATLLVALPFRRKDPVVFWTVFASFVMVGFQGWLGSRVVASNLSPGLITVHMLMAQLIVATVIYAIARSQQKMLANDGIGRLPPSFGWLLWLVMLSGLVQLVVGTQVREAVDMVAKNSNYMNRHLWIDNLPAIFSTHQWIAVPVVILNALLLFRVLSIREGGRASVKAVWALAGVLVATVVMGMSMERMHLPIFAQPLHLFFSSIIFGLHFFLYILWRMSRPRLH